MAVEFNINLMNSNFRKLRLLRKVDEGENPADRIIAKTLNY